MKPFVIKLFLFSLATGIADFCWNKFVPQNPVPHPEVIIGLFFLLTLVFHSLMMKNKDARPQVIVRSYMSGTVIRLFLYIIILLLYRFIDKLTLVPFAIAFIIHYFAFTAFEVMTLVKQFRNQSNL